MSRPPVPVLKYPSDAIKQRKRTDDNDEIIKVDGVEIEHLIINESDVRVSFNKPTEARVAKHPDGYREALCRIVKKVAADGGWDSALITYMGTFIESSPQPLTILSCPSHHSYHPGLPILS